MIKYLSNPALIQNLRAIPVPYTKEEANKYYSRLEADITSNPQKARLRLQSAMPMKPQLEKFR